MGSLSNQLAEAALTESDIYVNDAGYARDDEGNEWFVGRQYAGGTYKYSQLPDPPAPKLRSTDNTARIAAFKSLPERTLNGNFGRSILRHLQAGRSLSEPQRKAVRQMFYRARLRAEADLFR